MSPERILSYQLSEVTNSIETEDLVHLVATHNPRDFGESVTDEI